MHSLETIAANNDNPERCRTVQDNINEMRRAAAEAERRSLARESRASWDRLAA